MNESWKIALFWGGIAIVFSFCLWQAQIVYERNLVITRDRCSQFGFFTAPEQLAEKDRIIVNLKQIQKEDEQIIADKVRRISDCNKLLNWVWEKAREN